MNPVTVAAVVVTFTLCAVAAYVLLIAQARRYEARYEPQLEALRNSAGQARARQEEAEALVRHLLNPESTALAEWELHEFDEIVDDLSVDMGLEIFGDEGGAA